MMFSAADLILVTGGHGFIGGHVAKRLSVLGFRVRIADINPVPYIEIPKGVEVMVGNLCDPAFCLRVIQNVNVVLHFAATMGGMGVIHSNNDFTIYRENHTMSLNLISASVAASVDRFFYASSACVYPDSLQALGSLDVSLREEDVYAESPPRPQGLYGLEKLHTEHVLRQYSSKMEIRIARFHNVYGPGGCWRGGREKVPAALLRKAFSAKHSGDFPVEIEIWGDRLQRRSFCFIDDAVKAIIILLQSDCRVPINIGSDRAVTVRELADIAVQCAGLDTEKVRYRYVDGKPVGVGSRNSNNDLVRQLLDWEPSISLEDGVRFTGQWISDEIDEVLSGLQDSTLEDTLQRLHTSEEVDLREDALTFAILIPITSHGSASPDDCLRNLKLFARSLASTTAYDAGRLGTRYCIRIYLALDHDDTFLARRDEYNKAEDILRSEGFSQINTLICDHPRGHVCALWRDCAHRAWQDGCDYFTLMGDDVILQDANWMTAVVDAFSDLAAIEHVPTGFGCIAFTDTSFPGMPTFPVLHRTHMDIFDGEVIPNVFVNQDGDPFLFQLYRRWGCSRMISSRIRNKLGGSADARYTKVSTSGWTFAVLDDAASTVNSWLHQRRADITQKLTLDVIIPCYRVDLAYMANFLSLQPSTTCTAMFIIIIDDPASPNIPELLRKYADRPDVRVRINAVNLGASASRNRGLRESAAEWVIFLDDDVTPNDDILIEAEKVIRVHPDAAGFVGTALFPVADKIATAAIHLAGVTYFWDIARKRPNDLDLPWGVTANLIARRNVQDDIQFDLGFPKTGGGEDIDFCRKKRDYSVKKGGKGFLAAPNVVVTHPWWYLGRRSYWRFYMWSKGDGGLIARYPEFTYRQAAPNSAELLVICAMVVICGCTASFSDTTVGMSLPLILLGMRMAAALVVANILHDLYRHLWRNADRTAEINMTVSGYEKVIAVAESTIIRIFSEYGRLMGMFERREFGLIGMSFDWFTNQAGDGPRREENANRMQRIVLWALILAFFHPVH